MVASVNADNQNGKLLQELKRHAPTTVRAYLGDDDARDISVPARRRRWSVVIAAITARPWSRVELLDKRGAVLAYVDNGAEATEVEELTSASTREADGQYAHAERIVRLVLHGQREAMAFRDAEVRALLAAQGAVVRELTEGMSALTRMYREQVATAAEVGELKALASSSGGGAKEFLEAAPQLLQMIPLLKGVVSSLAPPSVPSVPVASTVKPKAKKE